jgi:hypothetical protein
MKKPRLLRAGEVIQNRKDCACMNSIPQTLKQRAIASYEAAQERKRHEEAEAASKARQAHIEHLRTLCTNTLDIDVSRIAVHSIPAFASNTGTAGLIVMVCEIDGLLFTCRGASDEYLSIVHFAGGGKCYSFADVTVFSLDSLGKLIIDGLNPGEIRNGGIYPKKENDGE